MSEHSCPGGLEGCLCCERADALRAAMRAIANTLQMAAIPIDRHLRGCCPNSLAVIKMTPDELRAWADSTLEGDTL